MSDIPRNETLSRRERRKERTYRHLLQSAEVLFRTQGYDATTVEEIAERADVAKGTVFNYFENKASILSAVLFSRTQSILRSPPGENQPAPERIKHLFMALWSELSPYRNIARRFVAYSLAQPEPQKPPENAILPIQTLAILIEQGQNQGHFRKDINVELSSKILLTFFSHTFLITSNEKDYDEQANAALLEQCLSLLYHGMMVCND